MKKTNHDQLCPDLVCEVLQPAYIIVRLQNSKKNAMVNLARKSSTLEVGEEPLIQD